MSVEEYLKDKLTNCSKADLRPVDQEFLDENGVEAFIFRMLMSKKFRKWKVDEEYKQQIKEAIRFNMKKQQPIELAFFFGGYKLWQLSSAPEVNWAEFFTLTFFSNYIAPILATYDHGVKIKFWAAHPSIMARQSNIPEDDCRKYFKSFESLIGELEKNFPANYKIEIHSIAELYPDEAEYKSELKTLIEQTDNKYKEEYDQEKIDKKLASSEMNIQWQGAEDWASLNAEERQEKLMTGPIVHDGYCGLKKLQQALYGPGKIILTSYRTPWSSIKIGTSSSSVTKYWVGNGVLENREGKFVDRILSLQQFNKVKDQPHEVVQTDLIPLKNFKEIWVYPEELRFS